MLIVSAADLEEWAKTVAAKGDFPLLLRRLVWATCHGILRLDFPGEHHVYDGDFDGKVDCEIGNHLVPVGPSGWELTTERRVTKKADEDYEKRTKNPGDLDRTKSCFIFATPSRWRDATKWESKKNSLGQWRAIRAISSHHLATWLDEAPWIATEFARLCLKKETAGLRTLEMTWRTYANAPTAHGEILDPEFVVAERTDILDQLVQWVTAEPVGGSKNVLRISAASACEFFDFIAAGIKREAGDAYEKLAANVVIIDDKRSALSLRGISSAQTIIGTGEVIPHMIEISRKTNCKVIILDTGTPPGPAPMPGIQAVTLIPIPKTLLIRRVIGLGYQAEEAARLCENNMFDYERIKQHIFRY